jgi:hypothetical protein
MYPKFVSSCDDMANLFVLAVACHPCPITNIGDIFIFQAIFCQKRMINILSVSRLQLRKRSAKL